MFTEAATKLATRIRGIGTSSLDVSADQVPCPRRGHSVEIDRCQACLFFVDTQVDPATGAAVIRCRRERGELLERSYIYS